MWLWKDLVHSTGIIDTSDSSTRLYTQFILWWLISVPKETLLRLSRIESHIELMHPQTRAIHSPTIHHEFVDGSGASRWRGLTVTWAADLLQNLLIGHVREWFLSNWPDLKQHHTIAPHITVRRILFVEESLVLIGQGTIGQCHVHKKVTCRKYTC